MSTAASELAEDPPEPAIRVAATGDLANPITRVQVPNVLLAAYRSAAAGAPEACHLPVSLLAAIGEVESGSLVGRELDSRHRTSILGPVLDGNGFAAVPDTDGGQVGRRHEVGPGHGTDAVHPRHLAHLRRGR